MKKIKFLLLSMLVLVLPVSMWADDLSDSNIIGHIVDKESGEHLSFYPVRLLDTTMGTNTDATGHYSFKNLSPGNYIVEASCMGYVTEQKIVKIKLGETKEVNFEVVADALQLEQVVVTGNKSEVKRRNSATLVNVVTNQIFNLVSAVSLADGLNFQPGVRVENNCQNCGFTQVRINGLDGHYSQILMNSKPVFSALAGVYGLEQIPANMIDRVEVMRGGGSALFGSSAIGGTINIITKDPLNNTAELSHTLTSIGTTGALDNNTTLNASVVTDNRKAGLFVYGQNRIRSGFDYNDDSFTEIPELKSQTLGIRSFMRMSDNTKLSLEYHGTHEFRRGGDSLNVIAHQANIAEQLDHKINSADATFDYWTDDYKNRVSVFGAMQSTDRDSYYGTNKDLNAYGHTDDLVVVGGAQYIHNFDRCIFMPSELIAGLEYNYNYLHDVTLGYNHNMKQHVHIYSGYLQNEWRTDKWGFLIGARLDKHSMVKNVIVSPRVNIRYNPSKSLNFRASYSTGFRAPQAFNEDFHVALVGGERLVTKLDPNLKEENSNSFSASVDWYHTFGNVQTNIMFEAFYTDLRDIFALRRLEDLDANGNIVQVRYNGEGARVWGVNLEGKAVFTNKFQGQLGITYQQSRYKTPEAWSENPDIAPSKKLFRTPDVYGYITMKYNPIKPLSIALSGTFTGSMLVQHLAGSAINIDEAVQTPEFFDANLKVAYDFKVFRYANLQLNAGVMNIFNSYQNDFDKGVNRDSGYIYGPMMPRSVFVGLKFNI